MLLAKEAIHHWRTSDKHLADLAAGQEKGPGDLPRPWALTGVRQTCRELMFSVGLKLGVFCCTEKGSAQGAPGLYEKASRHVLTNPGCVSHHFLGQQGKRRVSHRSGPAPLLVTMLYKVLPATNAL